MLQTREGRFAVLVCILVAAGAMVPAASGSTEKPREVLLEEGTAPGYRWGMLAHRDGGVGGGQRPCIVTIIYFRSSWGWSESDDTECGPFPKGGPPDILTYSFGDGDDQLTVFALGFQRRIASVELDLGQAGTTKTRLHLVNSRQRKIAKISPFRYGTFAVRGPFCLAAVTGYDRSGQAVYQGPSEECPE